VKRRHAALARAQSVERGGRTQKQGTAALILGPRGQQTVAPGLAAFVVVGGEERRDDEVADGARLVQRLVGVGEFLLLLIRRHVVAGVEDLLAEARRLLDLARELL